MILLDLEETVIDSWANGSLCNIQKIKSFLNSPLMKEINQDITIFSFAIWNDTDKDVFNKRFHDILENVLERKIVAVPTVENMMVNDTKITGVRFDSITDFVSIRGKVGAAISWCNHFHKNETVIFIDDVIPNATWSNLDNKMVIDFFNVNSL